MTVSAVLEEVADLQTFANMTKSYSGGQLDRQDHPQLHRPPPSVPDRQGGPGVFASQSAAVAAALEQMIRDEEERELTLSAMAEEMRARLDTPRADYVASQDAFAAARARLQAAREG